MHGEALGRQPEAPWQRAWWLATLATCGLTALGFLGLALRPSTAEGRLARGLPWLALDLGLLNGRFLPVLPARFDLAPPPVPAVPTGELAAHPSTPFRVMGARGSSAACCGPALRWETRSTCRAGPIRTIS